MKLILALSLLTTSLLAQTTNTYVSEPFAFSGKQHVFPCGISFWRFGQSPVYKQTNGTLSDRFFTPTTNVLSVTATNPLIMVQASDLNGVTHCGVGSVSWEDAGYASNKYGFNMQWPTNKSLQFPTNKNVPILAVGFLETTNSP